MVTVYLHQPRVEVEEVNGHTPAVWLSSIWKERWPDVQIWSLDSGYLEDWWPGGLGQRSEDGQRIKVLYFTSRPIRGHSLQRGSSTIDGQRTSHVTDCTGGPGQAMEITWETSNIGSLCMKADLALATSQCLVCQHKGPLLNPWYGTSSQRGNLATYWILIISELFHHGRAVICLHRHSKYLPTNPTYKTCADIFICGHKEGLTH